MPPKQFQQKQQQQQYQPISTVNNWRIALTADEGWLYNKSLKYLVIPILVTYCFWVMTVPYSMVELPFKKQQSEDNPQQQREYLYISPEGVRMTLSQPLNKWRLLCHSISGVIMIACSLIQKHSAPYMLKRFGGGGENNNNNNTNNADVKNRQRSVSKSSVERQRSSSLTSTEQQQPLLSIERDDIPFIFLRSTHKYIIGNLMLLCLTIMSVAGFIMRSYSTLPMFSEIMYLFVSPWIILGTLIYFTAKYRYCRLHVLIGNALLWSCFAVVVARLLGAVLQRLESREFVDRNLGIQVSRLFVPDCAIGLGDAGGYYSGIAASAAIFGVFLSIEAFLYFKRCATIEQSMRRNGGL